MSSSPSMNSPTASPTFSFPAPLPLRPQLMSIYKAEVSVKLDEENFLIWRLLVEPVIKGYGIHKFLTDSAIGHNAGSNNDGLEERDQILLSWILSTLSESMLKRVIGCRNSKQLWEKLHTYFKNRARAMVRKYQSELKNIKKKDTESISEYLLRIKILIDSLDFAGRPVNLQKHVDEIFEGLPEEYGAAVLLINNKSPSTSTCSVDEIEYILLGREVWIEEKKKKKKVQNNNESDESDRQSLNGNIYSGQQPIPPLPLTNSFLQQYPPNVALLAAAASDSQYSPPAWTSPLTFCSYHAAHINNMRPSNLMTIAPHSPQPQPPQPPLPPSYSSAWSYSQSNY